MRYLLQTGALLVALFALAARAGAAADDKSGLDKKVLDQVLPAVAKVMSPKPATPSTDAPKRSIGSAFLIDDRGYFLTNFHNVKALEKAEVTLEDGEVVMTESIFKDEATDLAVVKVAATAVKGIKSLTWAEESEISVTRQVFAVGAPFGLDGTVTKGIISRQFRALDINTYEDFLQTDTAVNPGNSGGPLVTATGEVVGVVTAIKSEHGNHSGVGFAIRASLARIVGEALVADGKVKRGYFGARMRTATSTERDGTAAKFAIKLTEVVASSPAEKGGLKTGDLLTELEGTPITIENRFRWALAHKGPDKMVKVKGFRDKVAFEKEITLSAPPTTTTPATPSTTTPSSPSTTTPSTPDAPRAAAPEMGWQIGALNRADAIRYGHASTAIPPNGVLITRVTQGTLSGRLPAGTILLEVEKTSIRSASDVETALAAVRGTTVMVKVIEPGRAARFILLK